MLRTCSFLFFGLGAAAAAATKSVLKQREVPATVSSFYVSVLYTAMLRTSIAAVVLGCCYICPLDCDAPVLVVDRAAVEARSMLEKDIPGKGCNKIRIINLFGRAAAAAAAAAAAHNISTGERYYFFFLVAALLLLFTHREGCDEKNMIGFCVLFGTGTQSVAFSVTGYVLLLFLTAPGSCLKHQY